jgi:hypothetical protein
MGPARGDDECAGDQQRGAAAVCPQAHQGIAGKPHCLCRGRHVRQHVPSGPGGGEPIKVSQAEYGQ